MTRRGKLFINGEPVAEVDDIEFSFNDSEAETLPDFGIYKITADSIIAAGITWYLCNGCDDVVPETHAMRSVDGMLCGICYGRRAN